MSHFALETSVPNNETSLERRYGIIGLVAVLVSALSLTASGQVISGKLNNWDEYVFELGVGDGVNHVTMSWSRNTFHKGFFYGSTGSGTDTEVAFATGVTQVSQINDASLFEFTDRSGTNGVTGPHCDATCGTDRTGDFLIWRNRFSGHYGVLRVDRIDIVNIPSLGFRGILDGTWWFQSNGSADFSSAIQGTTENDPLLPEFSQPPYVFEVEVGGPGSIAWYDPPIAVGYVYEIQEGPNYSSVQMPTTATIPQANDYRLEIFDGTNYLLAGHLAPGESYVFPVGGVDKFRILGIDRSLSLDPNSETAFPIGLSFLTNETVRFSITPVSVPEPSTPLLVGMVFAAVAFFRIRPPTHPDTSQFEGA